LAERIEQVLDHQRSTHRVVLLSEDDQKTLLAMSDLASWAGEKKIVLQFLKGGIKAWQAAGLPIEATPDQPHDSECIDFLFFVHDRHSGNRDAMRQYLAWETGLMAQVTEEDKKLFTLYEQVHG
jgi:hypothetical protein